MRYRDLSIDARLVVCVWGGDASEGRRERPLAVGVLDLFTELGVLRMGKQKLRLHWTTGMDEGGNGGAAWAAQGQAADAQGVGKEEDFGLKLEKAREAYIFNRMAPVDWLDRVTLPYTGRILAAELAASTRRGRRRRPRRRPQRQEEEGERELQPEEEESDGFEAEAQAEAEEEEDCGYLVIILPMFQHPVLYEEKAYPAAGSMPLGGGAAAALSSLAPRVTGGTPASSPKSAALVGPLGVAFEEEQQGE